jgi:hypothetical protein
MKKVIYILFVCLFASTGWTSYTYVSDVYGPIPDLYGNDTLLIIDEGGDNSIYLNDLSSATIISTSELEQGVGGIWFLSLSENSHLYMSGGQVNQLDFNNSATAELYGGLIQQIWSYQQVQVPHIKLYYSGDLPNYNETTDILGGLWGDGDPFSIYLHDVTGYAPVIDNIEFILVPEPMILALLAFGGLLIRSRNSSR